MPVGPSEPHLLTSGASEPDAKAGLAQHDLIAGEQPHATHSSGYGHGAAFAHDAGPVLAAVVVEPELLRAGVVRDVGVPARDASVHVTRLLGKGDVIRANQTVTTVADFGAAAEIDAGTAQHERAL